MAVVPIFVLWFGAGTVPAILTAMIICIFPIVVNVATGIATVEPELEDVMKTLKASKTEILWNVGLPRAMPYFFASLKVSVTLAFVGSVVAETVASNRGVGNMMMIASSSFNVPLVFAGLMVLAFLGVSLYVLFSLIERRVAGWSMRKERHRRRLIPMHGIPAAPHGRSGCLVLCLFPELSQCQATPPIQSSATA